MIKLNYKTDNFRWGMSGIGFNDWEQYALTLGLVSNIRHYRNRNNYLKFEIETEWSKSIELHIERNDLQGAIGKEGRIQYYNNENLLKINFPGLFDCRSAGNKSITLRFNSNDYMYSLIKDYNFKLIEYNGHDTLDIFPPDNCYHSIGQILINSMINNNIDYSIISKALLCYHNGWII